MKSIFGYYDNPTQTEPAYDPGVEGTLCPYCLIELNHLDIRSYSLMVPGDSKSFFYRVHRSCDELVTEDERQIIESSLIDMRA